MFRFDRVTAIRGVKACDVRHSGKSRLEPLSEKGYQMPHNFALSRFGGLRCPSEHLRLQWTDIDWEDSRIVVSSPKTGHHEGKASRVLPLFPVFPELRPHLEEAWEAAQSGALFVISRYPNTNANLRTQLLRIIKRAGLTPWPKLFHNLRATRQTELEERFPSHVVCRWIGNSRRVAQEHYLQVTDVHYRQAIEMCDEQVAQNPTQQIPAGRRTVSHGTSAKRKNSAKSGVVRLPAGSCNVGEWAVLDSNQ